MYSRLQTKLSEESTPLVLSIVEQLPSHSLATISLSASPWGNISLSKLRRTNGPQVATFIGISPNSYPPWSEKWTELSLNLEDNYNKSNVIAKIGISQHTFTLKFCIPVILVALTSCPSNPYVHACRKDWTCLL